MNSQILKHGSPVRLFPIVPESEKEQRTLSIVLATMVSVRPLAAQILDNIGVRVGKRSTISCYTEVTLTNAIKGNKDRPDALVVVETGKKSWSALIEAKVGKGVVETGQLERYLDLAKANNVDAVITITNELTPIPEVNPTALSKKLPKSLQLFHMSWASLLTNAFLLAASKDDPFENDDEAFLVSELIRYLEHPKSGRVPLDQMNKDWPKIANDVHSGHPINPKTPEIAEMISVWHQEARDVALLMTRKLSEPVTTALSRKRKGAQENWIEEDIKDFCSEKNLKFELDVPNAVSKIFVEADFRRRTIRTYMKLGAPADRKSNTAKLNWLLRQLKTSEMSRIIVTCVTHGRAPNFGAKAHEINPVSDEIKALNEIVSFQVEMSTDLNKNFNSRKKFIQYLEEHVPYFYQNVGEQLKPYVASPPKIKKKELEETPENALSAADSSQDQSPNEALREDSNIIRPSWASYWQSPLQDSKEDSSKAAKSLSQE